MTNKIAWMWYSLGIVLTLIWKWQRYCYTQKGTGVKFWDASKEWFEITTFGSKVSWGVTIGIAWVIGSVLITKTGAAWLFNGVLLDVPVTPPFLFLLGSLAEMTLPALAKWICSKLPFAETTKVLGGE
jgi:hypothetical protein